MTDLSELIRAQLELQRDSFGLDPRYLRGEDLAEYVRWNVLALEDELHEALAELRWKPWLTTKRGEWVDRDAFIGELVDATHFLLNLILASAATDDILVSLTPVALADEFVTRYFAKRAVNEKRQRDGYDGTKGADGRALDEPVIEKKCCGGPCSGDPAVNTHCYEQMSLFNDGDYDDA